MVVPRLPLYPLASQNIRTRALHRWQARLALDHAITCPWIALNTSRRVNALCIDIDHADGPDLVANLPAGCPKPTLVIDPWSGRSHAILSLATAVLTGEAANPKPVLLAKYALRLLAAALRADPRTFLTLVKCPAGLVRCLGGPRDFKGVTPATPLVWEAYRSSATGLMWLTQLGDGPAELRAVVEALADDNEIARPTPPQRSNRRSTQQESSTLGRNCNLFDRLRIWCYQEMDRSQDRISAEAARLNAMFPDPLSASEVASIVRSVAHFMQTKYSPHQAGARGRDRALNRGLDIKGRHALAGKRSAEQRRAANRLKIAAAVAELEQAGEHIRQRRVVQLTKLSERTDRTRPARPRPDRARRRGEIR